MKRILNLILLGTLIFSSLFFVFEKPVKAAWANHLVISEVQIAGQTADDEFIEIYNPSSNAINLQTLPLKLHIRTSTGTDYNRTLTFIRTTIPAHGFFLIGPASGYTGSTPLDATYSASGNKLVSNGGVYISKSTTAEVEVIDKLGWGTQPAPGFESAPFPDNPVASQSLERKPGGDQGNGEDNNNNSQDFILREISDPQNSQSPSRPPISEPPPEEPPPSEPPPSPGPICGNDICEADENYQNCPNDCPRQFYPSDIVINEFVADPSDDETEWIELYNKTSSEIDLTGWTIEDGTAKPKNLDGLTIPAGDFLVLEKGKNFSFALNNSGDIIILRYQSIIIDQVSYGDWDDGNKEDNAPATNDPNSIARITDGYDTDQDSADFKVSTTPTKGRVNQILNHEEKIYLSGVIINELLPNPQGDDSENEFIELKNLTNQEIDLEGWKIEDAAGTKFVISSQKLTNTKISAKGFFVLWRKDSKIALNNSGTETLKLYQPNDNLVGFVQYSGTVQDDHSYSRDHSNNWFWSTQATPGQENIIKKANQKPKAVISAKNKALVNEEIIFDASDSYDPDGDSLTYTWDFGDGTRKSEILVKHTYKKAGKYNIKLEVKDIFGAADTAKLTIEILSGGKITSFSSLEVEILITELLPNPKGSDDQEWIEIYNADAKEINLDGWFLDDIDGGSKPYKIKEKIILPGEYLVFDRRETKIALNNTFDSVRLLDPEGNLFFEISYEKPKEGFSYALNENEDWNWTSILTPGQANLFSNEKTTKSSVKTAAERKAMLEIPLSEIRNQGIGDLIKVQGIVSVEPGVLGSQIFYLAGSGIQIYFAKKDFPHLKLGDLVEIIGEISESRSETRIKISQKNEIKILDKGAVPLPKEIKIEEIDEDLEGSLVLVQGKMIESRTNYFYLDDGSGEIKIYLKKTTGIKKPKMKEGDQIKVIGIISQYDNEYRLLPRYQTDIEIIKKEINVASPALTGALSEKNLSSLDIFRKFNNLGIVKYFIVSFIVLLIILVGLLIKRKKYRKS